LILELEGAIKTWLSDLIVRSWDDGKKVPCHWAFSDEYIRVFEKDDVRTPFIALWLLSVIDQDDYGIHGQGLAGARIRRYVDDTKRAVRLQRHPDPVVVQFEIQARSPKTGWLSELCVRIKQRVRRQQYLQVDVDIFNDGQPSKVASLVTLEVHNQQAPPPNERIFTSSWILTARAWIFYRPQDGSPTPAVPTFWDTIGSQLQVQVVRRNGDVNVPTGVEYTENFPIG
jgi:hypothetical protein